MLSDLIHAPTRHVGWVTTHLWSLVPCITSISSVGMSWWFVDPINLGTQLWWSAVWIKGIHLYGFYPRLVKPFSCIHKTCEKSDNPYMSTCTPNHIMYIPGYGLVVHISCKVLANTFRDMMPGWRVSKFMYYIPGLWDHSFASTKYVQCIATHTSPLLPYITAHTSMWMPSWFCRSCQTWANIFGGLWPGWRASLCEDCIPGLS